MDKTTKFQALWQSPDKQAVEFIAESDGFGNIQKAYEWLDQVKFENKADRPEGWFPVLVSETSRYFQKREAKAAK